MNCGYGEKLALYFYGEADVRLKAEVELHLRGCAACKGELAALAGAARLLASAQAGPSPAAVDAVMRAARAQAFRTRRPVLFGFREAVAALSLAGVMAVVFAFSGGHTPADLAWRGALDENLDGVEYQVYVAQSASDNAVAGWEYSYGLLEAESGQEG